MWHHNGRCRTPPGSGTGTNPAEQRRSTGKDGLSDWIEAFVTTRGKPIWDLIEAVGPANRAVNKGLTNLAIYKFPTRPNPLSTLADYTSWDSLTDRTFDSRHLPATTSSAVLPEIEGFKGLFTREQLIESPKSTVALFVLRTVVHRRLSPQRPRDAAGSTKEPVQPRDRSHQPVWG